MKLNNYSSEGIVLARRNYGEADRIISLYSKDRGRITLLAKGIRRPKSRKRGHLEIFSLVKYAAAGGHGIDTMTEAEVKDDFSKVRHDLAKVSLAYYFMEVVGKITHEQEKNEQLFNLLLIFLNKLKSEKKLKSIRRDFIFRLLTLLGYWPESRAMENPDKELEYVVERQIASVRVGKRMLE